MQPLPLAGDAVLDLRDETVLVEALLRSEERADLATKQFAMFIVDGGEPSAELGRLLEAEVFLEAFGDTRELLDETYGPYVESTHFIVLVDVLNKRVAGSIRYLTDGPSGFRSDYDFRANPAWNITLDDIARYHQFELEPERMFDVLTLALRPEYRRALARRASLVMMFGLYWQGVATGATFMIGILDGTVFRLLNVCGVPAVRCCGLDSAPFLGSESSVPFVLDVASCESAMRAVSPTAAAIVMDGHIVDHHVSLPRPIADCVASSHDLESTTAGSA